VPWPLTITSNPKLLAAAALAMLISIGLPYGMVRTYRAGFEAGKSEAVVMIGAARLQASMDLAKAQRKLIETEQSMRTLEQEYAERLEQARAEREIQVRTVQRVIRENPDFAAIERPADLERVRDEQLSAIAAAAAGGSATATELPGPGIRPMPAPGDRDRRHARPDGDG